jgi:hypothetical protein
MSVSSFIIITDMKMSKRKKPTQMSGFFSFKHYT